MQFNHLKKTFLASVYGNDKYEYHAQGKDFIFNHASAITNPSEKLTLATTWRGYFGPQLDAASENIGSILKSYSNFCKEIGITYEMMRLDPISGQLSNYNASSFQKIILGQHLAVLSVPLDSCTYLDSLQPECRRNVRRGKELYKSEILAPDDFKKITFAFLLYRNTMERVQANNKWFLTLQQFKGLASSPGFTTLLILNSLREPVAMAGLLQSGTTVGALLIASILNTNEKYVADFLYHSIVTHVMRSMGGVTHINFGGGRTISPADSLLKFKKKYTRGETVQSKYLGIIHDPEIFFATPIFSEHLGYEEPYVKILKQAFSLEQHYMKWR
ncbi:hypothetical protein NHG95_28420 [Pseudomonas corrugata]|uniref:hypothetical protein n=1 Tax=Pseudomonas corrugata TaxID=47879 RepID=UPI0028C43BC2|nr:hypothetical protein [Pseudomonas corrugata]MDU9037060.1 hypothetical protein [Pseudomonas corrugata]